MEKSIPLPRLLIVDESRMARAMLVRQLRGRFEFREEADGESAWQVLVLDHSIRLVVCSLSLPVLDGNDLLIRVRSSRLPRLHRMPMLMLFGDDDSALDRARSDGASDFISRSAGAEAMVVRVESLLKFARAQSLLSGELEHPAPASETGLLSPQDIEFKAVDAVTRPGEAQVSVMAIGLDAPDVLRHEYGAEVVGQLQQRFGALLASKIRPPDSLGRHADGLWVVVAPGTTGLVCESFGNRLREAVHSAHIVVHGQHLNLSVSAGVSNIPVDAMVSGRALIELAVARLREAQQGGGNRVVSCAGRPSPANRVPGLDHAVALIAAGCENEVAPYLAALGRQVLPLLNLLERELALGLPLADLEKCLLDPARDVQDAGQD